MTVTGLKLQISRLFRARSSLTLRQLLKCGFTLKRVRDMIRTYSLSDELFQRYEGSKTAQE